MHDTKECTIKQKDFIKNAMQGALALFEADFKLFPLWKNQKTPMLKKKKGVNVWEHWATQTCSNKGIKSYGVNDCNWAIATGPSNLIIIDVDTKKYDGYHTLEKLQKKHGPLPETFSVLTPSGGKHIYFRDVKNIGPTGTNNLGEGIDTRAKGGYVVAPYSSFENAIYQIESNCQIKDCPDFIYKELQDVSHLKKQKSQDLMDNFDDSQLENSKGEGDRNRYLYDRACALRGLGLHKDTITTTLYEINELECDPPLDTEEVELISESASKYKPNQTSAIRDFALVKSDGLDPLIAHKEIIEENEKPFNIESSFKLNPEAIEPLKWIIYGVLLSRKVGIIGAAGGTGKSILILQHCVAVATGRGDIINEKVEVKGNCWYHNGEDSKEDIKRRLSAIYQHFDIPIKTTAGLMFTGSESKFQLAGEEFKQIKRNSSVIKKIKLTIKQNNIKVWVVDPLIKLHGFEENTIKSMDFLMQIFTEIAEETGCSIILVTHSNKASYASTGELASIRGASSQADAARIVLTLRTMAKEETDKYYDGENGIVKEDVSKRYVRLDSAKLTFAANPERAKWFRHTSVMCIHSGVKESVGVLVPVKLSVTNPNELEELTDTKTQLRKDVAFIMCREDVDEMSVNSFAKKFKEDIRVSNRYNLHQGTKWVRDNFIIPTLYTPENAHSAFVIDSYRYSMEIISHRLNRNKTLCFVRRQIDLSFLD